MAEILLFDHIGKTAGSTIHRMLWRIYGRERVFMSTIVGEHPARTAELRTRLDTERPPLAAVVAHTGYGLHERLPQRHRYRLFTFLRDPVQRTISNYYFEIQKGLLPSTVPLLEWLERDPSRAYNVQAAFLGGLTVRMHLDGQALSKDLFTVDLLERAKRALDAHEVVGLTERFDESLLLLSQAFAWPLAKRLYVRANVGHLRARRLDPTPDELEAVREANRLDAALYAYAVDLFEARLRERLPDVTARLQAFRRFNAVYARCYPVTSFPARLAARARRRVRRKLRGQSTGGEAP